MKQIFAIFLTLGFIAALNFVLAEFLNPYYLRILTLLGINVLMATSLNLINGYTGLFSLGHAGFMAVGAYTAAACSAFLHPQLLAVFPAFPTLLLFMLSLALGSLAAMLAGLIIGLPTLRLRGDYLAIATLGFAQIIQVIINNTDALGGARGFSDIPNYGNFFWVMTFTAMTLWIINSMMKSTKGKQLLAIREDEIAAASLGISAKLGKMKAVLIGSCLAGLGGGLFAHYESYISVNSFGFLRSIEFVVMVVLGGMGNLWGVVAAAALLTILPETLREFAEWRMIIYSLLIIITMLLRSKDSSWNFWQRKQKLSAQH